MNDISIWGYVRERLDAVIEQRREDRAEIEARLDDVVVQLRIIDSRLQGVERGQAGSLAKISAYATGAAVVGGSITALVLKAIFR